MGMRSTGHDLKDAKTVDQEACTKKYTISDFSVEANVNRKLTNQFLQRQFNKKYYADLIQLRGRSFNAIATATETITADADIMSAVARKTTVRARLITVGLNAVLTRNRTHKTSQILYQNFLPPINSTTRREGGICNYACYKYLHRKPCRLMTFTVGTHR